MKSGEPVVRNFAEGERCVLLGGRETAVRLTPAAERALAAQREPLDVEMELLFSCLVAKRLVFRATPSPDVAARASLTERMTLSYRAVYSEVCGTEPGTTRPHIETLSVPHPEHYVPKWLALDYGASGWSGEFGY
jgi:hypothetical protein